MSRRRPLMTGEMFVAWHNHWEPVLRRAYGDDVLVRDFAEHWPYSRRSLFDYRTRYLPRTGRSTSIVDELRPQHVEIYTRPWLERDKSAAHSDIRREELIAIERVARSASGEVLGHQFAFKPYTHSLDEARKLREHVEALQPRVAALIDAELRKLEAPE